MVGFDLKKQLKVHERSLLRQLFSKERAMRMVDWYLTPKNDIEPIAEAWENLQEDRKRHYQVVLQDVDLLSNVKGQKILVEELEAQPIPMIEKFWKLTSHADKSLWAYLHAPDVFETAAMFARAEALRNSKQSNAWNSLPKQPIEITKSKVKMLEDRIRQYYWNKQMRGKVCKIHHYQRQCGSQYFFAYLPDWPDKRLYFDEHEELAPKEDTYAFSNAFVFEPNLGIIELMANASSQPQGGGTTTSPELGIFSPGIRSPRLSPKTRKVAMYLWKHVWRRSANTIAPSERTIPSEPLFGNELASRCASWHYFTQSVKTIVSQ